MKSTGTDLRKTEDVEEDTTAAAGKKTSGAGGESILGHPNVEKSEGDPNKTADAEEKLPSSEKSLSLPKMEISRLQAQETKGIKCRLSVLEKQNDSKQKLKLRKVNLAHKPLPQIQSQSLMIFPRKVQPSKSITKFIGAAAASTVYSHPLILYNTAWANRADKQESRFMMQTEKSKKITVDVQPAGQNQKPEQTRKPISRVSEDIDQSTLDHLTKATNLMKKQVRGKGSRHSTYLATKHYMKAVENILCQIQQSEQKVSEQMDPEAALKCSYLRLKERQVKYLENTLKTQGKDPGIHPHSKIKNYTLQR